MRHQRIRAHAQKIAIAAVEFVQSCRSARSAPSGRRAKNRVDRRAGSASDRDSRRAPPAPSLRRRACMANQNPAPDCRHEVLGEFLEFDPFRCECGVFEESLVNLNPDYLPKPVGSAQAQAKRAKLTLYDRPVSPEDNCGRGRSPAYAAAIKRGGRESFLAECSRHAPRAATATARGACLLL